MKVRAIIPAAGTGTRIGSDTPKQYITLQGIPILLHTLFNFQNLDIIDEIVLVVKKGDVNWVKGKIVREGGITKIIGVVEGGKERQDSAACGLKLLWDIAGNDDIIIVHDGARPFVEQKVIKECIHEAQKTGACIVGIQIKETVKQVNEAGVIQQTIPSKNLWIAQTPQAFKMSLLKDAFIRAREEGFYGTDEASLVERTGSPIKIITGSLFNIKITYPEDIIMGEEILKMRSERI